MDLTVSESFSITGRGTAVFFERDPDPWLPWCKHRVIVNRKGEDPIETIAHVEFARKVPPGEVMSLVFPDLAVTELPTGTGIVVIEPLREEA